MNDLSSILCYVPSHLAASPSFIYQILEKCKTLAEPCLLRIVIFRFEQQGHNSIASRMGLDGITFLMALTKIISILFLAYL